MRTSTLPCSRPNGFRINLKSTLMKNPKLFRAAGTGARWLSIACLTLFCCQSLCAQSQKNADHVCTVRILDDDGKPVSGAAVVVKGSNTGEISDAKGFVRFRNIPRDATLLVTYLGIAGRVSETIDPGCRKLADTTIFPTDATIFPFPVHPVPS